MVSLVLDSLRWGVKVTEAKGKREASVTIAEGAKRSAILEAEGFAVALDKTWGAARQVDSNTMTLQYFETLKQLGASPATKFIFPMEFTGMLESFIKAQKKE